MYDNAFILMTPVVVYYKTYHRSLNIWHSYKSRHLGVDYTQGLVLNGRITQTKTNKKDLVR